MNLIEKLGGYDESKKVLYGYQNFGWTIQAVEIHFGVSFTIEDLSKELLAYRRQKNIFEVGDWVVYKSECKTSGVYQIKCLGSGSGDFTLSNGMKPWDFQVRHATDIEIVHGYRD
ncbi:MULTISPECIES: hypothetical protein [Enterobacteriaceae]|uniref:hypothetical protein n=1 Tax=Enterobacteriaceae TaxID=543 RepID=UPI002E29DDA6|nr:hypothetical protein [Klebsiella pneumoniae]MED6004904.1 hypothetical protein [Klebsiella pneumoniae]MED6058282.1 hypothetical protein [Klebsiella pneumoniae]